MQARINARLKDLMLLYETGEISLDHYREQRRRIIEEFTHDNDVTIRYESLHTPPPAPVEEKASHTKGMLIVLLILIAIWVFYTSISTTAEKQGQATQQHIFAELVIQSHKVG